MSDQKPTIITFLFVFKISRRTKEGTLAIMGLLETLLTFLLEKQWNN